jgi:hypothetical protein
MIQICIYNYQIIILIYQIEYLLKIIMKKKPGI